MEAETAPCLSTAVPSEPFLKSAHHSKDREIFVGNIRYVAASDKWPSILAGSAKHLQHFAMASTPRDLHG
jgi:hypothetical protein